MTFKVNTSTAIWFS
uniref:Uncharacterized protein n=1 Tax=Anguilla anguilla TaxID=7936 RepID=A0A0E9Q3W8_ANGAN